MGQHYKFPEDAVWVVYSESHYSVMFSDDVEAFHDTREGKVDRPFDLFYWDMLANQDEVIRLTVTPNTEGVALPDVNDEKELIPPLDLVVRTKWPGCLVDWNGSEAIL